ncbi:two-component system histidine kinase PnpS [Robertmurraya kyonggiensis]|uniref:histidine kinase n=1 Tax=Robertmurraya kyonggiensis TaxID=1037680 RepID=A0A4U1D0G8_9BACI|nr:ATP-binding protein [Robertmurraya kyonggiensis]TKC15769.1 PAS domain-containing protein [Robertmurraya kyonggiensis]
MRGYRTKLFVGLVTLIFAVLIGLGLLLGQLFKSHYMSTYDSRLNKESSILAAFLEESGGLNHLDQEKLEWYSETLDSRITIVNSDEKIVFDSGSINNLEQARHESIIHDIIENRIGNKKQEKTLEVGGGYNLQYYWGQIKQDDKVEGYLFLSAKLSEVQKAYQQIWWLLIGCLGTALVVILILGARITSRYTKPIESATKVAIELAKGNYRARTYEDSLEETGMLSTSINILARNLQAMVKANENQQGRLSALIENMGSGLLLINSKGHINLINRTFIEVFHVEKQVYLNKLYYEVIKYKEISEIIEEIFMTEHKVRRQVVLPIGIERRYFEVYGVPILGTNEEWKGILLVFHDITEIKKLEQVRKDFVANVSHELKTPITSIKGFTETLLDGAKENKETLENFLHIILEESNRIQSLILDLLELSKIEQQGYTLSIQSINLVRLFEEMLPILTPKAEDKNIQVLMEGSVEAIEIEGDAYRLKQIFINLISNAISYTLNGGEVSISIVENAKTVSVSIKDTGIGIEQEEIPRIFERFYRVDKARSRNSGGTGLGLAIVKHLVEAHKGKITVESEVGKGTTFTIQLHKKFPVK